MSYYRSQPELRCCQNCTHCVSGRGTIFCSIHEEYYDILPTDICDDFTPEPMED